MVDSDGKKVVVPRWVGVVKFVAAAVFVVGVLAQPVTMVIVDWFFPSLVYSAISGRVDPVSSSLFWFSVLVPPLGVLLWTSASVWKERFCTVNPSRASMGAKLFLGAAVAFVLLPMMIMVSALWVPLIRG